MSTDEFDIHRGIVRAVNSITGISLAEFPSHLNAGGLQEVSNVGLSQTVPGIFDMPPIGSMVFLATDARNRAFYVSQPAGSVALAASAGAVQYANASLAAHIAASNPHPTSAIAFGYIGQVASSSDVTDIAGTETDIINGSIPLVIGRFYEMTMRLHASQTVGTDVFLLRGYIGGSLAIFQPLGNTTANQVVNLVSIPIGAAVGGATTIRATLQRSSGTGTASCLNASYIGGQLSIKDVG